MVCSSAFALPDHALLSRIAYAVSGLLFGLLLIIVFELGLRALGVAEDAPRYDPFAGFSSAVPFFDLVDERDGTRYYEWSRVRARHFGAVGPIEAQRKFEIRAEEEVYRIFVTGGSSAAGTPYTTDFAFSGWLERRLAYQLPDVPIDVINTAMPAYGSGRLRPIVEELAGLEPDLLIIYMGHNEWAESSYHARMLQIPPLIFRLLEAVYGTRIYGLAATLTNIAPPRPDEIDIDIRKQNAQMFKAARHRIESRKNSPKREIEYRRLIYERNLHRMLDAMEAVGGRVAILTLSQNFADWAPPASLHRVDLEPEAQARWEGLVAEADRLAEVGSDCRPALTSYERALEIDAEFAMLHYKLARCQHSLGDLDSARHHYRRASDLDPVPLGAPTQFNEILRAVASERGAILVDVDAFMTEESGDRAVGNDLFTDFAHPNIRAHQRISKEIANALRAAGEIAPAQQWRDGFSPRDPADLYRADTELYWIELKSRVFVCIVSDRPECEADARELLTHIPSDRLAQSVLSGLRARGRLGAGRS